MDSKVNEMGNNYFVGNCKNGNDNYGYYTRYKNEKTNKYVYGITNKNLPKNFDESLNSDNSFCVISSLVPKNEIYKYNFVFPSAVCDEMFCSETSLTITINNEYIVCPRSGGKITVNGNYGFLLCPDYNLICTCFCYE